MFLGFSANVLTRSYKLGVALPSKGLLVLSSFMEWIRHRRNKHQGAPRLRDERRTTREKHCTTIGIEIDNHTIQHGPGVYMKDTIKPAATTLSPRSEQSGPSEAQHRHQQRLHSGLQHVHGASRPQLPSSLQQRRGRLVGASTGLPLVSEVLFA